MERVRSQPLRLWAEPLGGREFAQLMDAFAPFEPAPQLAVAVSGGSDSMALALLAADWAREKGGQLTALTVDHGLRDEAAAEAAQVASWCAAHGMAHATLRWAEPKPASGIQAAARAARYRLLEDWCRAHAVLHLLVAHQQEDQAETLCMRLARGSGSDGLAGMATVVERGAVRLLRPVLGVPRARLQATLAGLGQDWIEDPSNRNPAYLRTRLRQALGQLAQDGIGVAQLAVLASRLGRARMALESETARLLARSVTLHPAGFAWVDPAALLGGSEEPGLKALAAVLTTVSGSDYPPRLARLERLFRLLSEGSFGGRSLGGCLIQPRRGKLVICREPAAMALPVRALPARHTHWDGRFSLDLDATAPDDLTLGALGADTQAVFAALPRPVREAVPAAARSTLPALRDAKGVVAVPPLGYFSCGRQEKMMSAAWRWKFRPTRPLTGAGFRIV